LIAGGGNCGNTKELINVSCKRSISLFHEK